VDGIAGIAYIIAPIKLYNPNLFSLSSAKQWVE